MLDRVHFELSNISHMRSIGEETAQHLSRGLVFVVSDKMTQIKNVAFVEKYKRLSVL